MAMGAQPFEVLLSQSYMTAAGLMVEQHEPAPPSIGQDAQLFPKRYLRVKFGEPLPCRLPPIFSFYVPKMMAMYENMCRRALKRSQAPE